MSDPLDCDDYRAILRGICEEPQSDVRRLVAADWLDDRGGRAGEIQARFIRDQIANVVVRSVPLSTLVAVESVLGCQPCQCRNLGRKGVALVTGAGGTELVYRRGFVSEVRCTQAAFLEHAAAIFAEQPVTAVVLTDRHIQPFSGLQYVWPGGCWMRDQTRHTGADPSCELADPLFERLRHSMSRLHRNMAEYVHVDANATALRDLSRACVAFGRHRAGLSPLGTNDTTETLPEPNGVTR